MANIFLRGTHFTDEETEVQDVETTGSHFIGECVGGACHMLDAVYSTCVNSLISP